MENKEPHTNQAILVALVLWVMVFAISYVFLYAIDSIGVRRDRVLSIAFREFASPCIGAYVSIALIRKWFPYSDINAVVRALCLGSFVGAMLWLYGLGNAAETKEYVMVLIIGVFTTIGALLSQYDILKRKS